jgi:hypothetical protein
MREHQNIGREAAKEPGKRPNAIHGLCQRPRAETLHIRTISIYRPHSLQLTPPTYCDPILSFPGSRHSSISGGTPFGWNLEDDRGGDAFRVPSFADAGRVFSGFSGTGQTSDKDGTYGTPYQYRNFSLDTIAGPISRSASSATATSAERENRDER